MDNILQLIHQMTEGSLVTLQVFFLTLLLSLPLGLLLAIGNISKIRPLRAVIQTYILILRGTPLMLQILFVYFGLPLIFRFISEYFGLEALGRIKLNNFPSAIIAFVLNYAAYFAEIFRGGIQSIDKGQYEASYALGLSKANTMFHIIVPQSIRTVLPSISNETITLVKDTALVSVISLEELLRVASLAVQRELTVIPFIIAAVFYFIATVILTWAFNKIEQKFSLSE